MYIILSYDINAKRVGKALKICRKYLHSVQKSVFEGYLSDRQLESLKKELHKLIKLNEDSICIYKLESLKYTSKDVIGTVIQTGTFKKVGHGFPHKIRLSGLLGSEKRQKNDKNNQKSRSRNFDYGRNPENAHSMGFSAILRRNP